jgi:hypothetical protein
VKLDRALGGGRVEDRNLEDGALLAGMILPVDESTLQPCGSVFEFPLVLMPATHALRPNGWFCEPPRRPLLMSTLSPVL